MSPLDNGETPTANIFNHWDRVTSGSFASSSDNNAAIHRGNNGEVVEFTFASGQFDLLSVDIEGISLQNASSIEGTFSSSAGATFAVSAVQTVDFTAITSGWTNLS